MLKPALLRILAATMAAASLAGCESARTPPSAALTATAVEPSVRRAEIARQIARVCPATMTPDELRAAADLVERHADALVAVRRLGLFDRQSAVCRGGAP